MTPSNANGNVNVLDRIRNLSPEQRQLLERTLKARTATEKSRPISRRTSAEPSPLSSGQQRMWFLNQLQPDLANYNKTNAVRLTGSLDAAALQSAFDEILRRHELLRTTYGQQGDLPVQHVHPPSGLAIPLHDFSSSSAGDRTTQIRQLIEAEAGQPFDLTSNFPLRVVLAKETDQQHVLVITLHHIAMDAWSRSNLWHELSVLYRAYQSCQPSPLPELKIQYADFAVWQRNELAAPQMAQHLNYWQTQLADLPAVLDLPSDRPRPPIPSGRGGRLRFELPASLGASMAQFARGERATMYMVLVSAFQTLLHRYTGLDDIVVGSPMSGRTRVETEPLIGYMVNTLPMRTNLSGNPTFRELLGRVREVCTAAFEHQSIPFERLVEVVAPERRLSHQPIAQVMLSLQNTPQHSIELTGLGVEILNVEHVDAKFDLWIKLVETASSLRGKIEYNADLFDAASIERMLGHFQTILISVLANPEQRIHEISILTEQERHCLLTEWNETDHRFPAVECLHHLFELQAQQTPTAVAIECDGRQVTYRDLDDKANRLAAVLTQHGIGTDVPVALCLERTPDLIVGLLGILKAGGAYLPLDPEHPPERVRYMLQDAQATVLVTQHSLLSRMSEYDLTPICVDGDLTAPGSREPQSLSDSVTRSHLAYVLFTSGSTGRPKGVAVEHRSAVAFIQWAQTIYSPADLAGVLASTSIGFDLSVFEIFAPLSCGGRIILAPNVLALPTLSAAKRVTLVNTVPSAMAELTTADRFPKNVRIVSLGGEALSQQLVRQIHAKTNAQRVLDLYGPTEATVYATFIERTPEGPQSIGRPIANTKIYILDAHLEPVPIGVVGELYIGGAGLARGYLNRPNLTAERFIADPYGPTGSRLYKTGDLARYRADGNIEFLGRIDHQVKLRGFRIELGEIEAVLRQLSDVRDAAVVACHAESGETHVIGYVVLQSTSPLTAQDLRSNLQQRLPGYMVPSAIMLLDKLPLTSNGKLDRRALPAPDIREATPVGTGPRDALELHLTRIWEDVLNVHPIGIHDDFFQLGGHSLMAVKLFDRIARATGHDLPLATLFECATIAHQADILRDRDWSPRWKSLTPIQPSGAKRPLFLVPPGGGSIFRFADLARQLGSDQPVFGLQPVGYQQDEVPHDRVEEMAAAYVREILELQPSGPYNLAGVCFGGSVAWEMATQLRSQGKEVALIMLIDSIAPEHGPQWSPAARSASKTFQRMVGSYRAGKLIQFCRNAAHWRTYRLRNMWTSKGRLLLRLMDAHAQAQALYCASPLDCPVFCLQSEEIAASSSVRERWSLLAKGRFDITVVPGTLHRDLLLGAQRVPTLAKLLREQLDRSCLDGPGKEPCSVPFVSRDHSIRRAA